MAGDANADHVIQRHITELVEEEHALERGLALPIEPHRLDIITAELDRCWDLLRQRRARSAAGLGPDQAQARPASVVESYWQ
jgi:hypothetical protein